MTTIEIIIALTIHFIIPLAGLIYFLRLRKQMKKENLENAPIIELFIIFVTYGGVILVVLTGLFWYWSGIASLGTFYLILGAPIVMGVIAYHNRHTKRISKYHKWTHILGVVYAVIVPVITIMLFLIRDKLWH